jgi:carboxymethylenebutenolidase
LETILIEQQIDIPTKDGKTTTFITHPERNGPHPILIFYMDAPGIREELRDMCRRLASVGYYVMLPNLYYRLGVIDVGPYRLTPDDPARARVVGLMNSLTVPMIMDDTDALLAFAGGQSAASKGNIGCVGYCMSGRYAINAAVRFPRVAAAASLYGTRLVSDDPDSPHRVASRTKAELYVGYAEHDSYVPLSMIEEFKASVAGCSNIEVECYAGAHHAFAFPSRPIYDKAAAERHWERLFALFERRLKHG